LHLLFVLIWFESLSSVNLAGTKATGANSNGLGRTVNDSLYLADVGLPSSVCLTIGVGNSVSENNTLTTDTALCHNDTSLYALFAHLS
jgi:hypothetical protein